MKFRKMAMFLLCSLMLTGFAGCASDAEQEPKETEKQESEETQAQGTEEQIEEDFTLSAEQGDMHITIESKEIALNDLKASDYKVSLLVTLDKNGGITYSEWGVHTDERCTVECSSKKLDFSTFSSVNAELHFLWTAWASTSADDTTGSLLTLDITLPKDTKAGDVFTFQYADINVMDKPHVWKSEETDWVAQDAVTWTDGSITIKE